jgi:hypothetical protein
MPVILTGKNEGEWRAESQRQQLTEADWLTDTLDSICAEASKIRLSFVSVAKVHCS